MTAEQQQRINEAVKEWTEWRGRPGPTRDTEAELYDAWQAAQPPKWVVDTWNIGKGLRVLVRQEPQTTRRYLFDNEAEASAVCDALNALAERGART